jgi:hypothetical protein
MMTLDEVRAALAAVKRQLEQSVVIVHRIVNADGITVRTIRKIVHLPEEK